MDGMLRNFKDSKSGAQFPSKRGNKALSSKVQQRSIVEVFQQSAKSTHAT